jgi:hypothetical protein
MKEVADNALDASTRMTWGFVPDSEDLYFVEDNGPGLDGTPEEIASLFSIRRPMRSSKLLRLPQRGALGNGLRVVAGAALASEVRSPSSPAISGSNCALKRMGPPLSSA